MMEMVMGRMPDRFSRKGATNKPEYFRDAGRLDFPKPKSTKQSRKDVRTTKALQVSFHGIVGIRANVFLGNYTPNRRTKPCLFGFGSTIVRL